MKQTKKALATMAACTLIGAMAIGGTFAYLTDAETVTNTFTVGEVTIDLKEPNWDPDPEDPIVPNEVVDKDPTVENTGKNNAYVFVEVKVPVRNVKTVGDDGTPLNNGAATDTEVFKLGKLTDSTFTAVTTTLGAQDGALNTGWELVEYKGKDADGNATYLFGYNTPLTTEDGSKTTLSVFDQVKFANVIEGQINTDKLEMPVKAYAIQAESISVDFDATNYNYTEMKKVYDVYMNQNSTVTP